MTVRDFGIDHPLPAKDFRDDLGNRAIQVASAGRAVGYRGFFIVEKRDFGNQPFIVRGLPVAHGYVVTDGGTVNVMPGAAWFLTVDEAMKACDDLIASKAYQDADLVTHPFWMLTRFRRETEERAPELALLLQRVLDNKDAFFELDDGLQAEIVDVLGRIDDNCDTRTTVITVGGERSRRGPQPPRFNLPAKAS